MRRRAYRSSCWIVVQACALILAFVAARIDVLADLRSSPGWYDANAVGTAPDWHYRVPINVPSGASVNSTVKVDVDFNALLNQLGVSGSFDVNSPRIVRANGALSTIQEFTDTVYAGATDTVGNGRGEVRFLLEDAGPATYYLYFDITQNGTKPANPQTPINGNFEQGAVTGTQSPPGWTATKTDAAFDAQVRPSETVSVSTDGTTVGNGASPRTTDGTSNTGAFSYLLGARSNNEAVNGNPAVTLTRTITVPAASPGNISLRYRVEGWDSSDNAQTANYDWITVQLVGGSTATLVGPAANNYVTLPFSPNKGVNPASATASGYEQYNAFDTDTNGTHRAGMTITRGAEPWFTVTSSLAAFAGQTITLKITSTHTILYRTWFHVDDVEWSVVNATLGVPQGFGVNMVAPNDTAVAAASAYATGQTLVIRAQVNAAPTAATSPATADVIGPSGSIVASGVLLYNDGTHGDATAGDNVWTNDGSVGANPTYTFGASDPLGANWQVRVYAKDASTSAIGAANGLVHIPGQPNSPSVQANFFNIDEQIFTLAPTVSGTVYADVNHNGLLDGGETGTGLTLYAKLVQASSPGGPALQTAAVNPASGAYSFAPVAAGNYLIVLNNNNNPADVTPALPAGWVGTETANQTRSLSVAGASLPNQNFGLFNGSKLSGTVFRDDGAGGGTANDGVKNGAESGLSGATVKANNGACAGGTCDTATSDGAGNYTLWIPAVATGAVSIVETNAPGTISTGAQVGTTAGVYTRASDTVAFTHAAGSTYAGVNFGDVPVNAFTTDGVQNGAPGTTLTFSHSFVAGSAGDVTFSTTQVALPNSAGWNTVIYRDTNCNGVLDGAEGAAVFSGTSVTAGQTVCVIVKEFIPATATAGANDVVTVTASFTYINASPALVASATRTDTVTVGGSTANLSLVKSVDKANALPNEIITYTVTYTNVGAALLKNVVVHDATPAYTLYVGGSAGCPLLVTRTTCAVTEPANGATGGIVWTISGDLAAGASGTVQFQVRIQP